MNQERFLLKTIKVGDCLIWQGKGRIGPYGVAGYRAERWLAHRLAYHLATGEELGATDIVRHSCDTPLCVNYQHLTKGTHQDNSDDKVSKRRHRFNADHPMARLTEEDAADIRRLHREGVMQKDIATAFNISRQQTSKIVNNLRWVKGD